MKVLLDTHTLIWAQTLTSSLSRRAASIIATDTNVILVSAASAWEIATKVRLGRMAEAQFFEASFLESVYRSGYKLRQITVEDGLRAGRLTGEHQDPFDRIIAAQALKDDIPVLSVDPKLDEFGVQRIW